MLGSRELRAVSDGKILTAPLVLKFGGSSVANPERIQRVAKIIAAHRKTNERIVVVVSAMGDTTDELIELAKKVSPNVPGQMHRREMDMLLSTGERVSMALLSMALGDLGVGAISLTGSQSGIITTQAFGEACIKEIKPIRIQENLPKGTVIIVAGFQGVSEQKEITTLGRGGSDTSAVALAVVLGAKETVIYTDVDGYFSADPRKVLGAKKLAVIPWALAIEGASRGAQVLHPRCVELAWKHSMPIRVCTSILEAPDLACDQMSGTEVKGEIMSSLESSKVFSVALQKNISKIDISGFESPTQVAALFSTLSQKGFRQLTWSYTKPVLSLLIESSYGPFLKDLAHQSELRGLYRLSVVGTGLSHQPETLTQLFESAAQAGCQILSSKLEACGIEIVFEAASEKIADQLLNAAHKKLVEV